MSETARIVQKIKSIPRQTKIQKVIEVIGVSYKRADSGARCPTCKTPRAHVSRTLKWEGNLRIRYHCCQRCGTRFKSIEEN